MTNYISDETLHAAAKYSGDPWIPENKYFSHAEEFMENSWENVIAPFIDGCNFESVVDLAAGHGRNSVKLREISGRIFILDIQPGNVGICKERFAGDDKFSFAVNNGYDLMPVETSSVTLVYCFDAMVHFDSDVIRSYLKDTKRVLVKGGRGFFHHSNYTGGHDWKTNPSARNFMSKELFEHYAMKEGLTVFKQRVINWGGHDNLDCISLVGID